jgi:uncharacterized protein (DUF433 family)
MDAVQNPYLTRIVIDPNVRSGRPCVRDTRVTEEEILRDYPYLVKDDFKAVFAYAAQYPNPRTASR